MTEPDPTPVFCCFPWIQLVFCLACLSMTAWTWMRYSYAWPYDADTRTPRYVQRESSEQKQYLEVSGTISRTHCFESDESEDVTVIFFGTDASRPCVIVVPGHSRSYRPGDAVRVRGREYDRNEGGWHIRVDATASRLTGTSVAGLVVGAMGCFIFGLYLRAWLRERKALAVFRGPVFLERLPQ